MDGGERWIYFVDSRGEQLFRIPDGGMLELWYGNGDKQYEICRYVDEYQAEIGGKRWELRGFAERMERLGIFWRPLQ